MRTKLRILLALIGALAMIGTLLVPPAAAHEGPDDVVTDDPAEAEEEGGLGFHPAGDLGSPLVALDAANAGTISSGPSGDTTKNIDVRGIGARDVDGATTDVWALDGYAYTGTFGTPCGGSSPDAGIWVWDVSNANKTEFVTVIPSPDGSRSNDVRAATMNSGDILVHSNEACAGGPGGFEIYSVSDPANPVYLSSVRIDDPNPLTPDIFGSVTDVGVHNLWLFSQGSRDYVGVTTETAYGNFHIYEITDPSAPVLTSFWGAEESFDPGVVASGDFVRNLTAAIWLTDGFGASANRFLHDVTINADGTRAYLANWDAGLILLDISDPANPSLVSVAIDPVNGSLDGEVNSHSVWPSEDGTIVVEGEEDFAPFESIFTIDSGDDAGQYPSVESAIGVPITDLPGETMTGTTTYLGLACNPIPVGSGGIALIQRGACSFTDKLDNASAAGYSGAVVFNDADRGDAVLIMGGTPVPIPGVFVGHSTGLLIAGAATAGDLVVGEAGETVSASVVPNAWSGLRIWDYSDESNPVLMSTFDTVCSANPVDPSCDPAGTYSVHNVLVETKGNTTKAYVSWYSDGMLVLDVSDPAYPVEIGRYTESGTDFWGIYKETNSPFFYGSDRNGGLYVFKEQGSGSGK